MSRKRPYQLTLANRFLVVATVTLGFVFLAFVSICFLLNQFVVEAQQFDHSKDVSARTGEVIESFNDVGYAFIVYDAATKPEFEEKYVAEVAKLRANLSALEDTVKSDTNYAAIVKQASEAGEAALKVLAQRKTKIADGGRLDLPEALKLQEDLNEIVKSLGSIILEEKAAQKEAEAAERSGHWLVVSLSVALFAIVTALSATIILRRGIVRRLDVLMDNSWRLGAGEPLAQRLDGQDEISQIDRVFHDAAYKLKEAARKERAVIDNAVDVICSINSEGVFVAVSPAAEKLWGYPPSELIGTNWLEIIHSEDATRMLGWFDELRSATSDGETEARVVRNNKLKMDMRWSVHWSPEERLMFCVAHDVTERLELERFKQQFIAMISHDLRTPLTAVKSTLELLGSGAWGDLSEKANDKVLKAEDNLRHTIDLINNLIDLEKMQSGKIELTSAAISLGPLLKRCTGVVAPLAESRSIEFEIPDCAVTLNADEQRLSQVIINLLGNAVKFSPHQSKVSIVVESEKQFVRIAVNDCGPGIPVAERQRIFERYQQIATSGAEKQEGSGLGLAICKAIVEAHGGQIGVDDVDGQGSSFWFRIPAID